MLCGKNIGTVYVEMYSWKMLDFFTGTISLYRESMRPWCFCLSFSDPVAKSGDTRNQLNDDISTTARETNAF